jgi:murein DD-endopeptidase MepM/ murein hydrolase activator NlpD
MATFRSVACFGSSLLTLFTVTNGAFSTTVQPPDDNLQATTESTESLSQPLPRSVSIPLAAPLPPPETTTATGAGAEMLLSPVEGVHPSIAIPQIDTATLEGAIAIDAEKLEWARQKLLGRQLAETLETEAEAIAADLDADETDKTAPDTDVESETKTADASPASPGDSGAAPRWVATSMPLSVTFPDFSIQDFLSLPLRLPGNGNVSALFPLPIPASISSLFGWRQHPIFGDWRLHQGVDLAAPTGTPVLAAFSGTVKTADFLGGYGMTIILEHSDGTQETLYAHLSEILVEPGDWVDQGVAIGRVGSTGNSTGPHLHFEFRQLTEQGWIALDVNGMMQQALKNFGELPIAILQLDPNAPRSLKNPKKLAELGQFAGRVVMPERPTHTGSEGIFRGV